MIHFNHLSSIYIILIISTSLINFNQSSEAGNWLTKSLDYFGLEKCSPLDKSGIAGDFYACLNSPVESSSTTTGSSSFSSGKSSSGSGDWSKFGGSTESGSKVGGFGASSSSSSNSFSGKSGSFNSFSSGQTKPSTSSDSWPLSLITDLQSMINCFPKLIKPCMTESEVQFFDMIRNFFVSQVNYALPNASSIAMEITSSKCIQSNSIDTNTICYSTNIHKQNWFGWKINWSDGQMCRFINNISECEIKSFDKCSDHVKQFAVELWDAGLKVTPCLDKVNDGITTLSSPSSSPVDVNHVDQVKSLAPGLSVNPNQSTSSHLTNVTNINSNDLQSYEVTNLTVNNIEPVITSNQEDSVRTTPIVPSKRSYPRAFGKRNGNGALNRQFDDNNENEENQFDIDERTKDFNGQMKHSKLVRLHEVDGEGESRHDSTKKHHDVKEEQWSRIKEEFKRKMRESMESRESDESEYEEESEESDEVKNFDILEDRRNNLVSRQRNQEDDYEDARKDILDSSLFKSEEQRHRAVQDAERQRKRNEEEAQRRREDDERRREFEEKNSRRFQEEENRRREREERMREDEERRREADDRRREEEQRKEKNERRMEKERENTRKRKVKARGWEDVDANDEVTPKLEKANSVNRWDVINKRNQKKGLDNVNQREVNIQDCIESTMNSWSSLAENHNSNDLMDSMCRNMDSIHSCLNKHPQTTNGQAERLGQLKFLHSTLCDSNNRLKDNKTIERVKQCLNDQESSYLQTKYPNGASLRFWN